MPLAMPRHLDVFAIALSCYFIMPLPLSPASIITVNISEHIVGCFLLPPLAAITAADIRLPFLVQNNMAINTPIFLTIAFRAAAARCRIFRNVQVFSRCQSLLTV